MLSADEDQRFPIEPMPQTLQTASAAFRHVSGCSATVLGC